MKIKYLAGKKANTVEILDDLKAKSLIEDGLAEVVELTENEKSVENFTTKINEMAEEIATKAASKAVENVTKGLNQSRIHVSAPRELLDTTGGFKNMNHFLMEVKYSGDNLRQPTKTLTKYFETENLRLKTAGATPGGVEGSLTLTPGYSDGAPIPIEYLSELYKVWGDQPNFAEMARPIAMNSLSAKIPVDAVYDRSNIQPSSGLIVNEAGEANVIPNSKLLWEQRLLTLVTESIMAPVSNETLSDNNVNWGTVVGAQAVYQLRKQINGGIIKGTTSSCVGIIGNAGTKIVGRAASGTISFADILNMYGAFDSEGGSYSNAVWIAHPTTVGAIYNSTIGSFPAMIAPGNGSKESISPLNILGRPVYLTGYCNALGTGGVTGTADLLLVDFKQYLFGYKGGVDSFVSPHVFATSNQTGFRFTQRVNGQLGRLRLTTLEDGSTHVSPFVQLGPVGGSN